MRNAHKILSGKYQKDNSLCEERVQEGLSLRAINEVPVREVIWRDESLPPRISNPGTRLGPSEWPVSPYCRATAHLRDRLGPRAPLDGAEQTEPLARGENLTSILGRADRGQSKQMGGLCSTAVVKWTGLIWLGITGRIWRTRSRTFGLHEFWVLPSSPSTC